MPSSNDIQFKAKRDLLVISTILIFVNLAKVEISKFTVFGVSGSVDGAFWAYSILWIVWAYFGYRHVILNWGAFAYRDRQRWKFISLLAEVRALLMAQEKAAQKGGDWRVDESREILCKRKKVDEGFQIICEVPLLDSKFQPTRDTVELIPKFYEEWETEFNQLHLPKHEYFIDKWFPLIIMGITLLSGLPRLYEWVSQFIDWLP